jgi:HlyD family secretion protein
MSLSFLWRSAGYGRLVLGLVLASSLTGCGKHEEATVASVADPPVVKVIQPELRTIKRVVGQPSFVESYERTSIFPKVTGYIKKWNYDIGDKLHKDDVLATLFVPELEEDWQTKRATVKLDEERIDLAKKRVVVAEADVKAAEARLEEAIQILGQYEAQVERWDSEVIRLRREVKSGVVDPQVLLESENQLKSSRAARDAAKATILKARAELLSKKATLAKEEVNVRVAEADLKVAISEEKRLKAWVDYLTLPMPYDGIVVARNANTWDFVLPQGGDTTTNGRAPYLAPGGTAAPIYVVDRTDIVRIYVDIPEEDANYVKEGSKAKVQIQKYSPKWIPATVTRTAWALNVKSRTLRAEIDLPNENQKILPGMYAYGKVTIERPNVRAIPVSALGHFGESTYYWTYENGHAVKTEVQTGVSDGKWIEITARRAHGDENSDDSWTPINGNEQVILLDDLALLTEGAPVTVPGKTAEKAEAPAAAKDREVARKTK